MKKDVFSKVVCALIILSAFCAHPITAEENKNTYHIKVAASPVLSTAGIFLAFEKGYFEEQGLSIELSHFKESGAPMTVLLANGSLDVGGGNISAGLWNALAEGVQIKLVADKGQTGRDPLAGTDSLGLIVRNDHIASGRYKDLKDLKGFTFAVTAFGVSQHILLDTFLQKAGLTLADVTVQKMPYSQMNSALQNKELDATIQIEPFLTKASIDNIATLAAGGSTVYPGQQSAAIFYAPQFMKDHPDEAHKFMIAYLKGVRTYLDAFFKNKNKDEVIQLLKKHITIEDDTIWNTMKPFSLNPEGTLEKESLKADRDWYIAHGYCAKAPSVEDVVDDQYVRSAVATLGTYE